MFYFGTRSFTAFVNLKISLYFFLLNSWKGIYGPYNMVYSIHTPYVNLLFLTLMQTLDDRMFGALKSNSEQCSWPSVWFSKKNIRNTNQKMSRDNKSSALIWVEKTDQIDQSFIDPAPGKSYRNKMSTHLKILLELLKMFSWLYCKNLFERNFWSRDLSSETFMVYRRK